MELSTFIISNSPLLSSQSWWFKPWCKLRLKYVIPEAKRGFFSSFSWQRLGGEWAPNTILRGTQSMSQRGKGERMDLFSFDASTRKNLIHAPQLCRLSSISHFYPCGKRLRLSYLDGTLHMANSRASPLHLMLGHKFIFKLCKPVVPI